ncbi:hypothetical protein CMQ_2452 [Grosmannia clavigera kw1407]|uniref:Ribosome biogenesis protein ALB1 n=1 Tax=Grosmannia clavigera (strain kw1407 / UAMH 11150) TaxID=655863 RepID=F0XJT4_GROCL|nr:uncharacterized protein CMQ_2452 [Grosmannia clavigera kw1407]EFX02403.1 hypothetical protein CMQ_2452 [Grosmannia clavigera kw1407]
MPSVKNPNKPSRNRMAARAAHQRKQQQKRSAAGKLSSGNAQMDTTRGARAGLMPTSGPRAPLSAKKQKKVIQRMTLALQRRMAVEGADAVLGPLQDKGGDAVVEMTDAPVADEAVAAAVETSS